LWACDSIMSFPGVRRIMITVHTSPVFSVTIFRSEEHDDGYLLPFRSQSRPVSPCCRPSSSSSFSSPSSSRSPSLLMTSLPLVLPLHCHRCRPLFLSQCRVAHTSLDNLSSLRNCRQLEWKSKGGPGSLRYCKVRAGARAGGAVRHSSYLNSLPGYRISGIRS
jgi:hypothetical protein